MRALTLVEGSVPSTEAARQPRRFDLGEGDRAAIVGTLGLSPPPPPADPIRECADVCASSDLDPLRAVGVPGVLGCSDSNTAPLCQIGTVTTPTIDWLTLVQDHDSAPLRGSNLLLFIDISTGEQVSQAVKSFQHEGSHSSHLMIRCDGRRVEVSGNPSRWNVPHSLEGRHSLDECIELYSDIAESFGLPRFFAVERAFIAPLQYQRSDGNMIKEGMRITRIDLCQLFATGSKDHAAVAIRALGQVTHQGKSPMVYGNGETVAWGGGSRHVYVKYYVKGVEMLKHGSPESVDAAQWALINGVLRHEVTLKGMWLVKNGLYKPESWSLDTMRNILGKYAMHGKVGVARSSWSRVYEQLLDLNVPEGRARRGQEAAYAYLGGHVFRKGDNIPVRTFYRLRADLRLVGLDIAAPLNVSALQTAVRVVDLVPVALPQHLRRAS